VTPENGGDGGSEGREGKGTREGQQEGKVLEVDPLLEQDVFHKEEATRS